MRVLLAIALLSVALAGCNVDSRRGGDGATTNEPDTDGNCPGGECECPAGDEGIRQGCREPDSVVFDVRFESDSPAKLSVPFPHLDSCVTPQEWMAGNVTQEADGAELEQVDRGFVVSITGDGSVSWASQLDTADRPTCQTLRYDPWSIDPDPGNNETVEVLVSDSQVTYVMVLVRWIRDGCGMATLYEGVPEGSDWVELNGRSIPAGGCEDDEPPAPGST